MLRFTDSDLFPHDLIMDYFQSVAPVGYKTLYQLLATLGINPLIAHKLLPTILGLITTGYGFGICWQIFPVPFAGFLATLLLNQNLWLKDDLITATPRAFFYPLFLAFLYSLLRQSWPGIVIFVLLLGLFYPQGVLLSMAVLLIHLVTLMVKKLLEKSTFLRRERGVGGIIIGLITGCLVLLPYLLYPSEFGNIISLADAKNLPEFYPGGRAAFFTDKPWDFWLTGDRSGLLPQEWFLKSLPPQVLAGLLLPILLKFPRRFPLAEKITQKIWILPELLLASTGLFFLAHALLFQLHHPSRYSHHSLRIVAAISGGIAITLILDFLYRSLRFKTAHFPVKLPIKLGLGLVFFLLLCYPALFNRFPTTNYVIGRFPQLYEFLASQPKESLIASIATEANNLPAFAQRSILVGSEFALPYHQKYYGELQQRAQDLINAQYSINSEELKQFIQTYQIDFWLLESEAFTPDYVARNRFIHQFNPAIIPEIEQRLRQVTQPILSSQVETCAVFRVENWITVDTNCVVNQE